MEQITPSLSHLALRYLQAGHEIFAGHWEQLSHAERSDIVHGLERQNRRVNLNGVWVWSEEIAGN